jgi:hypothetical protein
VLTGVGWPLGDKDDVGLYVRDRATNRIVGAMLNVDNALETWLDDQKADAAKGGATSPSCSARTSGRSTR